MACTDIRNTLGVRASSISRAHKRIVLLALDLAAVLAAAFIAAWLHDIPLGLLLPLAPPLTCLIVVGSAVLGLPRIKLDAYESDGILRSAALAAIALIAVRGLARLAGVPIPDLALVLFAMIFFLAGVGGRVGMLHVYRALLGRGRSREAVILYGAGETGLQLAAALRRHETIRPVAFLDDNPVLHGMTLAGLRVHPPSEVASLAQRHGVGRVILTLPSHPPPRLRRIAGRLHPLGLGVQAVPSFAQLIGQDAMVDRLIALPPDLFLDRAVVEPAPGESCAAYAGRSILVTGAGGSIGTGLCHQLLACHPARLVLLDFSEAALYAIDKDLRTCAGATEILPVLGSITDAALLQSVFSRYRVDVVFHSAACKHVPLVEANPIPGIETNVFGTHLLAMAACAANVPRFVLISTDKAVRPCNVMGATKRLAEIVVQDIGRRARNTRFAIVRFGNVLGSSGSVVPLFREQIAAGGPVTLTHPEVTRYFMTLTEAARLVLAAGAFGEPPRSGADVFVLDMGQPVRIRDLALRMIEAAGLCLRDADHPSGDVEIVVTGLRPGEKLHEELLLRPDLLPTPHPGLMRAEEAGPSEGPVAQALRGLRAALATRDSGTLRERLFAAIDPGLGCDGTGGVRATVARAGRRAGLTRPARPRRLHPERVHGARSAPDRQDDGADDPPADGGSAPPLAAHP